MDGDKVHKITVERADGTKEEIQAKDFCLVSVLNEKEDVRVTSSMRQNPYVWIALYLGLEEVKKEIRKKAPNIEKLFEIVKISDAVERIDIRGPQAKTSGVQE